MVSHHSLMSGSPISPTNLDADLLRPRYLFARDRTRVRRVRVIASARERNFTPRTRRLANPALLDDKVCYRLANRRWPVRGWYERGRSGEGWPAPGRRSSRNSAPGWRERGLRRRGVFQGNDQQPPHEACLPENGFAAQGRTAHGRAFER